MADWERRTDPNSGREFWINHTTRETSWNPPSKSQELPDGWEEKRDAQGRVFFVDHNTKKTSWTDPRNFETTASSTAMATPVAQQQPSNSGGMSDEELARMLQEEEDVYDDDDAGAYSAAQFSDAGVSPGASGAADAVSGTNDADLARKLQEEWEAEEAASIETATSSATAKPSTKAQKELPACTFESALLMRHTIQAAGWRKVHARLHGSTFAIYAAKDSKQSPEVEVNCRGATLSELEAKGGMFSKKSNIFRFGVNEGGKEQGGGAGPAGSAGSAASNKAAAAALEKVVAGEKSRWAAESESLRGLWMAHLILAGAERPEPGLLCRCMRPLLESTEASEARAGGLKALADVVKQMVEAGEVGAIATALKDSGVLADVIKCLEEAPGQEHAARVIFYIGGDAACQAELHSAGAVDQLLDLLTTPEDALQTWAVAALRPLVAGNASATEKCLASNGIFMLSSLLSSPSPDIQGHALAALCTLLGTCTRDDTVGLDPVKAVTMVSTITDALAGAGGYAAVVASMRGGGGTGGGGGGGGGGGTVHDPRVSGVATQLVATLAALQDSAVTRALREAGAAPVLVGQLQRVHPPVDPEVQVCCLQVLVRLTSGSTSMLELQPTLRQVARDGGCDALLHLCSVRGSVPPSSGGGGSSGTNRVKLDGSSVRELAACVVEQLSKLPEMAEPLLRAGALPKLYSCITDSTLNARESQLGSLLGGSGAAEPFGMPGFAHAVGAYANVLALSGSANGCGALMQAIQSNGMDLVVGLLTHQHAYVSGRAVQLLEAFAAARDPTVLSLVHAVAGRGSGVVPSLLSRAMSLLDAAASSGGGEPLSPLFATLVGAIANLCGSKPPKQQQQQQHEQQQQQSPEGEGAVFSGHRDACSEVCQSPGSVQRLLGVVQGTDPAMIANSPRRASSSNEGAAAVASAVASATRLFEALCTNGPPEVSGLLTRVGAMGVVVGHMQGQGLQGGSSDTLAARLAALRTFEQMCAQASPDSPELARGVAAVAKLMSESSASASSSEAGDYGTRASSSSSSNVEVAVRAVQVLRRASEHVACRAAIVERGCGPLVDLLLGDTAHLADPRVDSRRLVADVLSTLSNVSKDDARHAAAVVAAGGIFALANLASSGGPQQGDPAVDVAGLATSTLGSLARHPQCRTPILECGAATGAMLGIIVQSGTSKSEDNGANAQDGGLTSPGAVAAIETLELLMGEGGSKHASVVAAVAGNAEVGPCLAGLLTCGDKRLREKAARLLYLCAAASGPGAAFWQALERSGHTAAIVAVLATAALGIKAGHGPGSLPGKLAEQSDVAAGACGSLTALCHRSQARAVEVVNAGGLNYLVQLASVQNLKPAAACLATVIFQTDVHRSTLLDGDGAACDVLLEACVKMLGNNTHAANESSSSSPSSSSAADSQVEGKGKPDSFSGSGSNSGSKSGGGGDATILEVAVGILASLCSDSDELASRLAVRLSVSGARKACLAHLAQIAQHATEYLALAATQSSSANWSASVLGDGSNGSSIGGGGSSTTAAVSGPVQLSATTSNALVVLSTLLVAHGGGGGGSGGGSLSFASSFEAVSDALASPTKLELVPDEALLVSTVSAQLLDLLHNLLPSTTNTASASASSSSSSFPGMKHTSSSSSSSSQILRRRLRACVVGLAATPQCAEAMFTQSRAVPALVALLTHSKYSSSSPRPGGATGRLLPASGGAAAVSGLLGWEEAEELEAEADVLAALGVLHHLCVALPAAAPRAVADHPDAVPFLVACLDGKHKSDRHLSHHQQQRAAAAAATSSAADDFFTEDLLGSDLPVQQQDAAAAAVAARKQLQNTEFEGGSEGDVAVRVGALRLLLDLATAPSTSSGGGLGATAGGQPSIRQRVASHQGLLEAVSTPLRRAAAAVAPPPPPLSPQHANEHVDLLIATPMEALSLGNSSLEQREGQQAMPPSYDSAHESPFDPMAMATSTSSPSSSPFGASPFASNTLSSLPQPLPPLPQETAPAQPSWASLPSVPPTSAAASPPAVAKTLPPPSLVLGSEASVAEQALAVRILGELAGSDEATRFAILALPGCLAGAVALLAVKPVTATNTASGGDKMEASSSSQQPPVSPAALESMRASVARLVRNLTLSLVAAHVAQAAAAAGTEDGTLVVGGFDLSASGGGRGESGGAQQRATRESVTLSLAMGDGYASVDFDVSSLHATLVQVVVADPDKAHDPVGSDVGGAQQVDATVAAAAKACAWVAASESAWALRTLMAFGGGLELTREGECAGELVLALQRCAAAAAAKTTSGGGSSRGSSGAAAVVEPLVGAVHVLSQQPDAVPGLVEVGLLEAIAAVLRLTVVQEQRLASGGGGGDSGDDNGGGNHSSSSSTWLLAVEASFALSAAAFHPAARRHPAMKLCLDNLRAAVRADGGAGAGVVLAPLADRVFAACGQCSPLVAAARRSGAGLGTMGVGVGGGLGATSSSGSSFRSAGNASVGASGGDSGSGGHGKPLKVPGWTSGPANESPAEKLNTQQQSAKPAKAAVVIPSADSIAEFAAAAASSSPETQQRQGRPSPQQQQQTHPPPLLNSSPFSSSVVPPPPSPPPLHQAPALQPDLRWSESADEALARKLQEEDNDFQGGGQGHRHLSFMAPPLSPYSSSTGSSSMVSDEEFARRLQESEQGGGGSSNTAANTQRASFGAGSSIGSNSSRAEPPPPPLSTLGGYNPPPAPPSYGSI